MQGVPVNQNTAHKLADKYLAEIKGVEDRIAAVPVVRKFRQDKGHDFRPSATADVSHVLYEMLRLEGAGTKEAVLEKIDHPLAKLILEYRGVAKPFSTYVKPCYSSPTTARYSPTACCTRCCR